MAIGLYVTELTGSPSDVGLVLAAYTLPLISFLLVGGVWADRLRRQRLMAATDVVRCVLHALLAVLVLTEAVEIWHMVVIGALFGTAQAFFQPAYTGLVPQTVPEEDLQAANALGWASLNVGELLGPALATVLVLGVGAGWAFALDAATFAFSAALLIGLVPRTAAIPAARQTVWRELVDGFAEVRSRVWVWVTLVVFCLSLLIGMAPFFVLGAGHAEAEYGDKAVFGVIVAIYGAGALAGSLTAIRLRPRRPMVWAYLLILAWPLMMVLFAAGVAEPGLFAISFLGGAGVSLFQVWWLTALAEHIPAHALSRVTAWDWAGSLGLLPLGYLLAGPAAEAVGTRDVLMVGAVGSLVLLALGLLPRETRSLGWAWSGADHDRAAEQDDLHQRP